MQKLPSRAEAGAELQAMEIRSKPKPASVPPPPASATSSCTRPRPPFSASPPPPSRYPFYIEYALANILAPEVVVPAATDQYKNNDDKNTFQVIDTLRAVGGSAKRLEFAASDPTYNCPPPKPSKLPSTTTNATRPLDVPLRPEEAKTQTLVSSAVTSHEAKVFAALTCYQPQ